MIGTRWHKVLSDLWSNKIRTLLVVLSIAVGIFSVGYVSSTFSILLGDMEKEYLATNPSSGFIITEDSFDQDFAYTLKKVPGVAEAEARSMNDVFVMTKDGKKINCLVTAIDAFEDMKIDRARPNTPNIADTLAPLGKNEAYLERSGLDVLDVKAGDILSIKLEDGTIRNLKIKGIVYNIFLPPYTFTNMVSVFVNPDTMVWLDGERDFNTVFFTVSEKKKDQEHVANIGKLIADKIEKSGRKVEQIEVDEPGRHWASDVTEALGNIMSILGALAVFLSGFLVINTINNLLSQHVRQIGVMRAIGGRSTQIIAMYTVLVLAFGILAFIIAVPVSSLASYATATLIANMLNFNLGEFRIPVEALIMQLAIALIVPILAALVPIFSGVRVSVRDAISEYGLGTTAIFGKNLIDRTLEKIRGISRPMIISLRNTFRRKARLALTLSTLTLGGAIFIGVFNVRGSITNAIEEIYGYFVSDINVSLNQRHRIQQLEPLIKSIPGVEGVEGWGMSGAEILSTDKVTSNKIFYIAPPSGSELIKPVMTSGRWLLPEDKKAIVIGNSLIKIRPGLKVGEDVVVEINKQERTWRIVGIYQMAGNMDTPIVYTNYESLASVIGKPDQFSELRVITSRHDGITQERIMNAIEKGLNKEGIKISNAETSTMLIEQEQNSINILIVFLLIMAVLIAIVGGIGLTATMSMNVMERTREIGVMRATGASDGAISRIVIAEGMTIGTISWLLGIIFALPITYLLNFAVGSSLLNTPLNFILSYDGFFYWLIIIIILSTLSSLLPARHASRLTVREILAYE